MSEPKKIVVMALKGGVGKTTICLGIAQTLRDKGKKVGLLDVDIHASALPRALHLKIEPGYDPILGGKLRPIRIPPDVPEHYGFQMFSIGLLFTEETPNMWDGETKASAVKQIATTSIAWDDDLDWVVVDTPPTSGDEIQSLLANLKNIYGAVIICQPNDLAVLALTKTLNVLRATETPISGVIANMAGYRCPYCGRVSNPFDRAAEDVAELAGKFGVNYLGTISFGSEAERRPQIKFIVNRILSFAPVILTEKKGGLARWVASKILS